MFDKPKQTHTYMLLDNEILNMNLSSEMPLSVILMFQRVA